MGLIQSQLGNTEQWPHVDERLDQSSQLWNRHQLDHYADLPSLEPIRVPAVPVIARHRLEAASIEKVDVKIYD